MAWLRLTPLCALFLLVTAGSSFAEDNAPASNVLEFRTAVRTGKGVVRCGLFDRRGWLKRPVQPATARIAGNSAICRFEGIRPGTYALSAFHDENANGRLDTNLLGIPSEDYCASRDARGMFGPPSFEDAKFKYPGGYRRLDAKMQ